MTAPAPDGSRDRRIEDLSNLLLIHPAARALVAPAIRAGVSANMVSCAGLVFGAAAATAYGDWRWWPAALGGVALSVCWLIADGLDGMVARATGTSSAAGRVLDGVVDHGVFIMIYVALAASLGTLAAWAAALAAGACHAVQSMLYEGERARYHRRLRLEPAPPREGSVPIYDHVARVWDRAALAFDALLAKPGVGDRLARDYGAAAAAPMKAMALLSANVRVFAIFLACLLARPALFWWFEIGPLTLVTLVTALWHRHVETRLAGRWGAGETAMGANA